MLQFVNNTAALSEKPREGSYLLIVETKLDVSGSIMTSQLVDRRAIRTLVRSLALSFSLRV